jgi:hypothetical protein
VFGIRYSVGRICGALRGFHLRSESYGGQGIWPRKTLRARGYERALNMGNAGFRVICVQFPVFGFRVGIQ